MVLAAGGSSLEVGGWSGGCVTLRPDLRWLLAHVPVTVAKRSLPTSSVHLHITSPPHCPAFAGGRGGRGRGSGGRGGGREGGGREGSGGGGAEAFFNPSMLENPWEALERRLLPQACAAQEQQRAAVGSPSADPELEGRGASEGAADRPWH